MRAEPPARWPERGPGRP